MRLVNVLLCVAEPVRRGISCALCVGGNDSDAPIPRDRLEFAYVHGCLVGVSRVLCVAMPDYDSSP